MSSASTKPTRSRRTLRLLATGMFTVPAGVYELDALCVGPGGGGGSVITSTNAASGGGGGGGWPIRARLAVTPGEVIVGVIGSGAAPTPAVANGTALRAGSTTFREISAPGGGSGGYSLGAASNGNKGADSLSSLGGNTNGGVPGGGGGGYSGGGGAPTGGGVPALGGQFGSGGGGAAAGGGNVSTALPSGLLKALEVYPYGAGGTAPATGTAGAAGANGTPNSGNGADGAYSAPTANGGAAASGGTGGSGLIIVSWEE